MKMQFQILRDRPKVKISITRDSVCAGDDCDVPHERLVEVHSFTDPKVLINHIATGYLPTVAGIGHSWDCKLNGRVIGSISSSGINPKAGEVCYEEENRVHFVYHSSRF